MAIGTAAMAASALFAPDNTWRVMFMLYSGGFMSTGITLWWLFFSGLPWKTRLAGIGICLIAGVVGSYGAIRGVQFDGDMRPRFQWRWQPDPKAKTAEWLSKNSADSSVSDSTVNFQLNEGDWSRYCGPIGSRIISEPQLESPDWKSSPPAELWRHPVGEAWSSFAVAGGRVFTQEQRGPAECVTCYDAESGKQLWVHQDTARYETAMGGIGPRATPTVTQTAVYSLGATGLLNCLDPLSGTERWQRDILEDAGSQMIEWGMSGSPLIYDNLLIVDAGGEQGRAVIAYRLETGEIAWSSQNHKAGYAAPRIETFGETDILIIFHGDGLLGMDPLTGERLWEYPWTNIYKINVAQPLRFGDQILISSGYDSGCVLLDPTRLSDGRPAEVWAPQKSLKLKFNEAVQFGDYVYGLDDGILACIDSRTGERSWKGGRYGFGQLLLWGDQILVQAEKGYVALVAADPEEFKEITRFDALSNRTWNVPVVSQGRLYVRNADEAACFKLK
ncbi:MAG: PQQ-like beta-propeller repeat protein [Planctomyces sp.]|nr:PQQ-like beta-propeller repeat protein [Planctomyces sp.]